MLFRLPRLMNAYRDGRKAILVGLYKLFVSMIRDALGSLYDSETIQGASANVINRLIGRPESRPDPREVKDPLGQELRELCSTTMVREAAALVLLLIETVEEASGQIGTLGWGQGQRLFENLFCLATHTPDRITMTTHASLDHSTCVLGRGGSMVALLPDHPLEMQTHRLMDQTRGIPPSATIDRLPAMVIASRLTTRGLAFAGWIS